jgi:hypothetical protein
MLTIDGELATRAALERSASRVVDGRPSGNVAHTRTQPDRRSGGAHAGTPRAPRRREPPSRLMGWLEQEREKASRGGPPPTLAERARAAGRERAAARTTPENELERRRRQFGRDQREGLE